MITRHEVLPIDEHEAEDFYARFWNVVACDNRLNALEIDNTQLPYQDPPIAAIFC